MNIGVNWGKWELLGRIWVWWWLDVGWFVGVESWENWGWCGECFRVVDGLGLWYARMNEYACRVNGYAGMEGYEVLLYYGIYVLLDICIFVLLDVWILVYMNTCINVLLFWWIYVFINTCIIVYRKTQIQKYIKPLRNKCATKRTICATVAHELHKPPAPAAAVTLSSKNTLQYLFDLYST